MYVQIEYLSWGSRKPTKSVLRNGNGDGDGEEKQCMLNNFIEWKGFIKHYQRKGSLRAIARFSTQ